MQKICKKVKTQKSTINPMSSFGLIEESMELSNTHLAVQILNLKLLCYFCKLKTKQSQVHKTYTTHNQPIIGCQILTKATIYLPRIFFLAVAKPHCLDWDLNDKRPGASSENNFILRKIY